MTRELKWFAAVGAVWTACYIGLVAALALGQHRASPGTIGLFVVFSVLLTSSESYFQSRDDQRSVRYSLRPRYTAVSMAYSLAATAAWALAWHHSWALVLGLGLAGLALSWLTAYVRERSRIKGYRKKDLFP